MAYNQENVSTVSEHNIVKLNDISLETCFKNIIEGNALELDLDNLNNILRSDLQLNFYVLKPKVKFVLSYMLVHFIKSWPGWQRRSYYINKQISFENWYAKFKEYLVFKINYLIKNDFEKVKVMLKSNPPIDESVLFRIDNSTQTVAEKVEAPFSIEITGFPKMLNTLVFCEGVQDNIIVKEYRANPFDEKTITTKQLINWPYIEIEFISRELQFKRKNVHEIKRYLTFSTEKITFKKTDDLIEEVEVVNKNISRLAYTLNVMKEYCDMYVNVLKKHYLALDLNLEDIDQIKIILEEFVLDITELSMNSIATNTSILFNIGSSIYARNKSVRTSDQAVSFAEFITPKINVALLSFTAIKDVNSITPFENLQEMYDTTDINLLRNILPIIKYNCTYCNKFYNTKSNILKHFTQKHCMEQPVLCFKCKLQMNITTLAENRWRHKCGHTNSGNQSIPR